MSTVCLIDATRKSPLLPGKLLLSACGVTFLELLVERLRQAPVLDQFIVGTLAGGDAQPVQMTADWMGIRHQTCADGPVVKRLRELTQAGSAEVVVRIDSSCPLIDPAIVGQVLEAFHGSGVDYAANDLEATYPQGMSVQVFRPALLEQIQAAGEAASPGDTLSQIVAKQGAGVRTHNVTSGLSANGQLPRLALETPADLELVQEIAGRLFPANPGFHLGDILQLLEHRPELRALNEPGPTCPPVDSR